MEINSKTVEKYVPVIVTRIKSINPHIGIGACNNGPSGDICGNDGGECLGGS